MEKIKQEIEELTSDILLKNDMFKVPVDIIQLASNYNIDVYKQDLGKGISGAIRYDDKSQTFSILLNQAESQKRQRFTLAHELGHYFMHRDILISDVIHIDTLYRMPAESEKEVDYFAGALLMNKTLVEKAYKEGITSIAELSETFKVSESAMTVRLDILGLL